jgi:hypothetical protein
MNLELKRSSIKIFDEEFKMGDRVYWVDPKYPQIKNGVLVGIVLAYDGVLDSDYKDIQVVDHLDWVKDDTYHKSNKQEYLTLIESQPIDYFFMVTGWSGGLDNGSVRRFRVSEQAILSKDKEKVIQYVKDYAQKEANKIFEVNKEFIKKIDKHYEKNISQEATK